MQTADETRASIARRRLEALFDAQIPRPVVREGRRVDPVRDALRSAGAPRSHAAEPPWRVSPAHLRVAVSVAVAAGILLTWWLMSGRPRTSEPQPVHLAAQSQSAQSQSAQSQSAQSERGSGVAANSVIVDVSGKVRHPGIVTLKAGSRVHEAIAKAGGPSDGADTTGINLARILADGEQIIVGAPSAPAGPAVPGTSGAAPAQAATISLSSATLDQLDTLPGIGPVTAQAIIDFRTERGGFRAIEDLLDVTGIGEKTLADLRDQVTP